MINGYIKKLTSAFPQGMTETEYKITLYLLYDEFCDENLTEIISKFSGKMYSLVYNDIQWITYQNYNDNDTAEIHKKLKQYGLLD